MRVLSFSGLHFHLRLVKRCKCLCVGSPPLFLSHSLRGSHLREFLVLFFSKLAKKVFVFFTTLAFFLRPRQKIPSHPVMEFYSRSIFIIVRHFQLAIQIYHHSLSPTLPLSASLHFLLLRIITHRILHELTPFCDVAKPIS